MPRFNLDAVWHVARRVARCLIGMLVLISAGSALCGKFGAIEYGPLLHLAWSASGAWGEAFSIVQVFLALLLLSGRVNLFSTICLAVTNAVILVGSGAPTDLASLRITQCLLVAEGLLLLVIYDEKSTALRP